MLHSNRWPRRRFRGHVAVRQDRGVLRFVFRRPGRPLMRGTGRIGQRVGGIDQGDMRESLREIAQVATGDRVVLLGQQPKIVRQSEQPLEQAPGLGEPAAQGVGVAQPEACRR